MSNIYFTDHNNPNIVIVPTVPVSLVNNSLSNIKQSDVNGNLMSITQCDLSPKPYMPSNDPYSSRPNLITIPTNTPNVAPIQENVTNNNYYALPNTYWDPYFLQSTGEFSTIPIEPQTLQAIERSVDLRNNIEYENGHYMNSTNYIGYNDTDLSCITSSSYTYNTEPWRDANISNYFDNSSTVNPFDQTGEVYQKIHAYQLIDNNREETDTIKEIYQDNIITTEEPISTNILLQKYDLTSNLNNTEFANRECIFTSNELATTKQKENIRKESMRDDCKLDVNKGTGFRSDDIPKRSTAKYSSSSTKDIKIRTPINPFDQTNEVYQKVHAFQPIDNNREENDTIKEIYQDIITTEEPLSTNILLEYHLTSNNTEIANRECISPSNELATTKQKENIRRESIIDDCNLAENKGTGFGSDVIPKRSTGKYSSSSTKDIKIRKPTRISTEKYYPDCRKSNSGNGKTNSIICSNKTTKFYRTESNKKTILKSKIIKLKDHHRHPTTQHCKEKRSRDLSVKTKQKMKHSHSETQQMKLSNKSNVPRNAHQSPRHNSEINRRMSRIDYFAPNDNHERFERKRVHSYSEFPRESSKRYRPNSKDSSIKSPYKNIVSEKLEGKHPRVQAPQPDSSEDNSEYNYDLRTKLSNICRVSDRILYTNAKRATQPPRENLKVTLNNDNVESPTVNIEENTEKTANEREQKHSKLKTKTKKCKRIKLIINVKYQSSDDSDSNSSSDDSNSGHILNTPRSDLSFLDDINVEEIVNSLKLSSKQEPLQQDELLRKSNAAENIKNCNNKSCDTLIQQNICNNQIKQECAEKDILIDNHNNSKCEITEFTVHDSTKSSTISDSKHDNLESNNTSFSNIKQEEEMPLTHNEDTHSTSIENIDEVFVKYEVINTSNMRNNLNDEVKENQNCQAINILSLDTIEPMDNNIESCSVESNVEKTEILRMDDVVEVVARNDEIIDLTIDIEDPANTNPTIAQELTNVKCKSSELLKHKNNELKLTNAICTHHESVNEKGNNLSYNNEMKQEELTHIDLDEDVKSTKASDSTNNEKISTLKETENREINVEIQLNEDENVREVNNFNINASIKPNTSDTESYINIGVSGPSPSPNIVSEDKNINQKEDTTRHFLTNDGNTKYELENNSVDECSLNIIAITESNNTIQKNNDKAYLDAHKNDTDPNNLSKNKEKKKQEKVTRWSLAHIQSKLDDRVTEIETGNKNLINQIENRALEHMGKTIKITYLAHEGKFSKVFKASDDRGVNYAVKVLRKDRPTLGMEKEVMLKQTQKSIPKTDLNIVYLFNAFAICKNWCFLFEYYPVSLRDIFGANPMPFHIDKVLELSKQLISAVRALRNNNIVHSDIKPSHILLNASQTHLKLCGFDESYYNSKKIKVLPNMGTGWYRAPEIILGHSASFSVDVWSTAIIIYQMATREKLFKGSNNDMLYSQMRLLGYMPLAIVRESTFGFKYFTNDSFIIGPGQYITYEGYFKFRRTISIYRKLMDVYSTMFWDEDYGTRRADLSKISLVSNVLQKMLVIDPRDRMNIDFVKFIMRHDS